MNTRDTHHLKIDELEILPQVARRLAPTLAWRYRALPLAEEGGQITVAMADPQDAEAVESVMAALGSSIHVVQADAGAIEGKLAQLWTEAPAFALRVLAWAAVSALTDEFESYAQAVTELLGGSLELFETPEMGWRALQALSKEGERGNYDLIVFNFQDPALLQRLCLDTAKWLFVGRTSTSVLIAPQPRWPLRKILLVIQNEETVDHASVAWAVRLARPSRAMVTVLPIIPTVSHMFDGDGAMQPSLPALVSADTPLGQGLRKVARHLVNWGIESAILIRAESPFLQVYYEVCGGDYDLVIMAAESHTSLLRWLTQKMTNPFQRWNGLPVLIPSPHQKEPKQL